MCFLKQKLNRVYTDFFRIDPKLNNNNQIFPFIAVGLLKKHNDI